MCTATPYQILTPRIAPPAFVNLFPGKHQDSMFFRCERRRGRQMKHFLLTAGASAMLALAFVASGFAAAPQTTSPPTIERAPIVGKTLTAGNGLWRNSPDTFSYRWMRCDAKGNNCNRIRGAGEKTYDLVNADVGHTILVL